MTAADHEAAAKRLGEGISAIVIRAFAEVECGGRSGFGPLSRPAIAFEGHIFRKLTRRQYDFDYPLLSYKYVQKAGSQWRRNNRNQETAWEVLGEALALDHAAALKSCSWGMFQVMGFNFSECGYANIDDFVAAMRSSERGQLEAFVGYCKAKEGLVEALRERDFIKMATLYNGSDHGDYDKRMERAYGKLGGS